MRKNRTITVDFHDETTYSELLGNTKAFVEFVLAFILALGLQLLHKASGSPGGCLTRHSHDVRIRLGGMTIWRIPCTRGKAVFTVLPHFVLRDRSMRPAMARNALLATPGGLSRELCAIICHLSPMALDRLVCALGHHGLVTVRTRCGLALPPYFLADEKHRRCLTEKGYVPTMVYGRVIWHLGYTEEASATAFTQSYGAFQRATSQQEPSYRVKGVLTDGFDSTTKSLRTLFPGARLGNGLRHALNNLPKQLAAIASPVRQALRSPVHTLLYRARQRKGWRVFALGQRLRHCADHVAHSAGVANGERVRRWFQDKKAGWYAVLADPQMPVTSTWLDQAHHAFERKLFALWGGSGRRGSPDTGLVPQPSNPHFRRLSMSGEKLDHYIRWNVEYSFCRAAVRKEHPVAENTSKPAARYQIVDAMENAFKAGDKWEVLDTDGRTWPIAHEPTSLGILTPKRDRW
jgi:hypothetical protein